MLLETLYTLKESEDLHFYIARVTASNKQAWLEFSKKSEKGINDDGVIAFLLSLEFYNHPHTEVWVAFISNKEIAGTHEVHESSIEMFVTTSTSDNANFSSHMGIARSNVFVGTKHQNISTKLHTFAAKFMLQQHPEKIYMINTPTEVMRNILIEAFERQELGDKVSLCEYKNQLDYDVVHSMEHSNIDSLAWAQQMYDAANEVYQASIVRNGKMKALNALREVHKTLLDVQILKQQQSITNGEKTMPVIIEQLEDKSGVCFNVHDKSGQVALAIGPENQHEEFAWFFEHRWLWGGISKDCPLITCDLEALANLYNFEDKIHLVGCDE